MTSKRRRRSAATTLEMLGIEPGPVRLKALLALKTLKGGVIAFTRPRGRSADEVLKLATTRSW
jgi:hypothetical protein